MPDATPSAGQVHAALEELLGWQGISRSPQLAELLKYVVEKTLAGDDSSIKAYSIAVDVFGRPPTFDPQADPIVRVQARRLRTLLEQYYDLGRAESAVQIHLPLGRYVPDFQMHERPVSQTEPLAGLPPIGPSRRLGNFLLSALLGLGFTLAGVALAVFIIRWTPVGQTPTGPPVPEMPRIAVGNFDNLTGDDALDPVIATLKPQLAADLGKFETLEVTDSASSDGLLLTGGVQKTNGRYDIRVMLSEGSGSGTVWTATVTASAAPADGGALDSAALQIIAQLAGSRGPLHAPGRSWLTAQQGFPARPNLYTCQLQFMIWRDNRRVEDAMDGVDCFAKILTETPDDAIALAGHAALRAWWVQHETKPGDNLAMQLADEAAEAARAVSLKPDSSFASEMQATVLARQSATEAASAAYRRALELNPGNMDATASYGLRLWLNGDFAEGSKLSEQALGAEPSPPPWYYQTRAFDALREARYFDAIDAAQALAAADNEYGPVTALAAAPIVGRNDLIDRYRPIVLNNSHFQSVGILPRLSILIKPQILLDRLKAGLILAGVPPAAVAGPFKPNGTPL